MLVRLIAPDWLLSRNASIKKIVEGDFTLDYILKANKQGYNVYYLPNGPSNYTPSAKPVEGKDIDQFHWCFVDMDLKEGKYPSKEAFIEAAAELAPTKIVDSGNGVHAYWRVTDLDAKTYLLLNRRLTRRLDTDEAVGKIMQLMRLPGTLNTKKEDDKKECSVIYDAEIEYTVEELNGMIPPITQPDREYCERHYNTTYGINDTIVTEEIPAKFGKLLKKNQEVKDLWAKISDDRSKSDYRLANILMADGFSKEEARLVLINSAKAITRSPAHRLSYANNIIDKIWTYEETKDINILSPTVRDVLTRKDDKPKGARFPCHRILDDTHRGFRLGQVIGIIGGAGVGKTTLTLNTFIWFAEHSPSHHHFYFSLEQPVDEMAERIKTICGDNEALFDKIHLISNFVDDQFMNYSIDDIHNHLLKFKETTKNEVGAVVIDHIGVLNKANKHGENEGLIDVCKKMKPLAVNINCMLIMLSQAPREKAGIGDLVINKDAAYGTVFFESYLDYGITLWQPLKRAYAQEAPTIMAFQFVKIRHKNQLLDRIKEDVYYYLYFDPQTERLRELTQLEEKSANYFNDICTNLRKLDRKTDVVKYTSRRVENETPQINDNRNSLRDSKTH